MQTLIAEEYPDVVYEVYSKAYWDDFIEGTKLSYDGKDLEETEYYRNVCEFEDDDDSSAFELLEEAFNNDIEYKLVL